MRRSHAPSLRNVCQKIEDNENQNQEQFQAQGGRRGTEELLNLVLGVSAVTEINENFDNNDSRAHLNHKVELSCEETNGINHTDSTPKTGEVRIFNVVYAKQSKKKHKTWEGDGTLEVGQKLLTLRDEGGKIIGTACVSKMKPIEEGSHLYIGSKEVEIMEAIQEGSFERKKPFSPEKQTVKKRKLCGKRFIPPILQLDKSKSVFILPEPNPEHQWHFNETNIPVTEVCVDGSLAKNLRQHQRIGVIFLYECIMGFRSKEISGAILADDMGLGKTLQTIALIWTLLKKGPYGNKPVLKKVLIVTPSSLTMNWFNEFIKWLGKEKMVPYVIDAKNKPQDMKGPVMIISYEMFVRYYEDVKNITFDLLVCDEGHRLKNGHIRTTQLLRSLNCPKRILLTGTPIQNDLKEFYTLVDFVNPNILGTPTEFRRLYEEPILASRMHSAELSVALKGAECASDLNRRTSLFLLRRTKEILDDYLPSKNEVVVFCKITPVQQEIYNNIINVLIDNNEKLSGFHDSFFHLGVIMSLKKVCNHPALLWKEDTEDVKMDFLLNRMSCTIRNIKENFEAGICAKLTVLIGFLHELKQNFPKERVVVVSNSTQTLDLLERSINEEGFSSCRLDGSTPAAQRAGLVERFNWTYSPIFVFLLSSKAGGVGLNLTGASRLILYDSDWNPATDLQAMSRIWRDGQKTSVYIYRFLTVGTIEEKVYQRQINKQGLCDGIIDPVKSSSIVLSQEEVKDIFSFCEIRDDCATHEMLSCKCSGSGEVPVVEEEERRCQLIRQTKSSVKMNELFHWEHHGPPINPSLLSELCLLNCESSIGFIFRTSKKKTNNRSDESL